MSEGGGKGLVVGLILAVLAAIGFFVLWFLRGGDIDRLNAEVRSAQTAASSATSRLESDLRAARNESTDKDRRIAELERRMRDDVRRAEEEGRNAVRRVQSDLESARNEIDRLRDEADEATQAAVAEAESRLDEATALVARAEEEQARLTAELEAAVRDRDQAADELTNAQGMIRTLEQRAAADVATLAAMERDLAEAHAGMTMDSGDAGETLAAVQAELDAARAALEAMEQRIRNDALRLTEMEEELAAARSSMGGAATDSSSGCEALERELDAAREREQELMRQVDALRNELAGEREKFSQRMTEARDVAIARIESLEQECTNRLRAAEERLADCQRSDDGAPPFAEGRVFGRMSDGTLLISGGAAERMRPGLKFDAYRTGGGRPRYVGGVRVIRVLDGYSLAVPAHGDMPVRVCPETGRVIMDAAVTRSPYAPEREPVAAAGGDIFDAPGVGDYLDNPFFTTRRPLKFGLADDVVGNVCVVQAVTALGGIPLSAGAEEVDVTLVWSGGDALRRVTLDHLAAYLDPRPVF